MAYYEGEISPITTNNGGYGNGAFGGDWAWIVIIFLIFGWGRGGYGFGGGDGQGSGVMNNYVLTSDFSQLSRQIDSGFASQERKLDGINNGLCSLGYQELQNITGVNTNLFNGFANVNNAITTGGYETRNAINGVGSQLASCCCELKGAIADVKYANAINTRDIIESANANYRALHDEIIANRIEDKNAQITAQQNEINALRLKASQEAQNAYLINELKGCPKPAYIVPNPNCCYNYNVSSACGCSNGI